MRSWPLQRQRCNALQTAWRRVVGLVCRDRQLNPALDFEDAAQCKEEDTLNDGKVQASVEDESHDEEESDSAEGEAADETF